MFLLWSNKESKCSSLFLLGQKEAMDYDGGRPSVKHDLSLPFARRVTVSNLVARNNLLLLTLALITVATPISLPAQEADSAMPAVLSVRDSRVAYRLNLVSNKLEPITASDLKVGYVYYHFSPRLNRWAWSYYQATGSFWHAFGVGSIQEAWCFDLRETEQQLEARLKELPKLAEQMNESGRSVCMQLQADGRWQIIGTRFPRSILNAETGERWQWNGKSYIRVISTGGTIRTLPR
jgi:hypothetical protein